MERIVASNAKHLKELVREELSRKGQRCCLNRIDVSRVDDFSWLFSETEFDGDVSEWDVSRAVDMTAMFRSTYFNGDLSRWNVGNVTHMALMFEHCPFNGDVSRWNTSSLVQAYDMFRHSGFAGDVHAWDVSSVLNMNGMFANSEFKGCVASWDVARVRDMSQMFDQLDTVFDLHTWTPSHFTKAEAMLSAHCLDNMTQPCFYHWYAALTQHYHLPEQWKPHWRDMMPIAHALHADSTTIALFLQEQWHRHQSGVDELLVPPSWEE